MKILWIFFFFLGGGGGGVITNWTIFSGYFNAFYGLFIRSRYRIGIFFWVAKISNIFGVLKIPEIF